MTKILKKDRFSIWQLFDTIMQKKMSEFYFRISLAEAVLEEDRKRVSLFFGVSFQKIQLSNQVVIILNLINSSQVQKKRTQLLAQTLFLQVVQNNLQNLQQQQEKVFFNKENEKETLAKFKKEYLKSDIAPLKYLRIYLEDYIVLQQIQNYDRLVCHYTQFSPANLMRNLFDLIKSCVTPQMFDISLSNLVRKKKNKIFWSIFQYKKGR